MALLLASFDEILVFGWIWEHFLKPRIQREILGVLKELEMGVEAAPTGPLPGTAALSLRNHVSVMMDDVPSLRCGMESPWRGYDCTQLRDWMRQWKPISKQIFTLTSQDADNVRSDLQKLWLAGPPVKVWPMRMSELARLFPQRAPMKTMHTRTLTMIASTHPANWQIIKDLLVSGALEKICKLGHGLRVAFVGSIARFRPLDSVGHKGTYNCVKIYGGLPDTVLTGQIMPKTVAILNPIMTPIASGITVKSYEAIALGIPIITSAHGLLGLEECARQPLLNAGLLLDAARIDDTLVDFVRRYVDDRNGYKVLENVTRSLASRCIQADVPIHELCRALDGVRELVLQARPLGPPSVCLPATSTSTSRAR